ncbi:unnamed protein product [Ceutorhynchus assimilis]|uniref:Uncharacterized protein n=1 Tax=Ceutorhynchus assimilis TaxID=467358 RepID=A0A9P0DC09_9CUCU|nr:unnamed protein product [Ceutorhynchus assimilis]
MLYSLLIGCLNFACLFQSGYSQAHRNKPQPTPYHDFDYLVFSQRWPLTACTEWEEAKQGNTCNLPKDKDLWTVHGVWPTKTGKMGPLFCPSAIHFNPDQLAPILTDLNHYWINVEANTKTNSFWAHEWNKHGTCASVLPQLDSVPNYFEMGLKLNRQYDLSKILSKGGIVPGTNGYDVSFIYNVIKNAINREPSIQCVTDRKTKESFINEIRICLNKTFDAIDCDASNPIHRIRVGLNTNCNQKKPVWYIDTVPSTIVDEDSEYNNESYEEYQEFYEQQRHYTWLYNFIRTLLWVTL